MEFSFCDTFYLFPLFFYYPPVREDPLGVGPGLQKYMMNLNKILTISPFSILRLLFIGLIWTPECYPQGVALRDLIDCQQTCNLNCSYWWKSSLYFSKGLYKGALTQSPKTRRPKKYGRNLEPIKNIAEN